jgi:hypothetical protein
MQRGRPFNTTSSSSGALRARHACLIGAEHLCVPDAGRPRWKVCNEFVKGFEDRLTPFDPQPSNGHADSSGALAIWYEEPSVLRMAPAWPDYGGRSFGLVGRTAFAATSVKFAARHPDSPVQREVEIRALAGHRAE